MGPLRLHASTDTISGVMKKEEEVLKDAIRVVRAEPKIAGIFNDSGKQVADALRGRDVPGILANAVPLFLTSLILVVVLKSRG